MSLRESDDPRGLLGGQPFAKSEPKNFELAARQRGTQFFPKIVRLVPVLGAPRGRWFGAGDFRGDFLPLPRGPEMIEGRPPGDGQQPVYHRPAGIKPIEVMEGLDEGLLRQVLRILALARHPVNEMKHPPMMEADDLVERPGIAAEGIADEAALRG